MDETWHVPWQLLGLPDDVAPPRRVAVRIAPPEVLSAHGGGFVLSPGTFDWEAEDRLEPVAGGLYDEDTFGPLPRTLGGGVDVAAYQTAPFARRPQLSRSGEILLATGGALHPWVRRFAIDRATDAAGVSREEAEGLLSGTLVLDADEEVVAPRSAMGAGEAVAGAEALRRLARSRGRRLEGYLRALPVLPAGLRPVTVRAGELLVPDPTWLYQGVIRANEKVERCLAQGVAARFLAGAVADLQTRVEALLLDGLDEDGLPPAPGQPPGVRPFRSTLAGPFGAACAGDLAKVTDLDSFMLTLRGPVFAWRAIVEASCLEVVLLREDGTVDEAARRKILTDVAAGAFADVYDRVLGAPWQSVVVHGPLTPGLPHVDVLSFAPASRRAPARLVTAGMSTELMGPGPGVELAELTALVRPDLGEADAVAVMRALLELGLYPFRHRTSLGPGHDVGIGAPLVPGSELSAWVLYAVDDSAEEWAGRASDSLPRHPQFLLAVAVTEAEQRYKTAHGAEALRERLVAAGALVVDPGRRSIVP